MTLPIDEKLIAFAEIQQEIHENAQQKGFWSNTDIPTKLMLIVTEVAEAMEVYREAKDMTATYYTLTGKPEGFGIEIADVIIRCFDLLEYLGLDAGSLIIEKMGYNADREYLHGKKV